MSGSSSSYAIISLVSDMRRGKVSRKKCSAEIARIEREYEDPFLPTSFTPKEKPWDKKYLDDLSDSVMYGKSSKDYLLHIAEVSEAVYRPIRLLKAALAVGTAVLAILLLLQALKR